MNFVIGSDVEVTTKYKSNLLGRDFDINTVKGKVVENPKWLGADYVSIATGKPEWPVSMIRKDKIVGFSGLSVKVDTRIFRVTSKQSKKTYNVVYSNSSASCDCLGYQFRQSCKHSKKVLDRVNERC